MDKQTLLGVQAALHQRTVIANLISLQTKHSHLIFEYGVVQHGLPGITAEYQRHERKRLRQEIDETLREITDIAQNLTLQTAADQEELVAGQNYEAEVLGDANANQVPL